MERLKRAARQKRWGRDRSREYQRRTAVGACRVAHSSALLVAANRSVDVGRDDAGDDGDWSGC